jgi:hypothetical protein
VYACPSVGTRVLRRVIGCRCARCGRLGARTLSGVCQHCDLSGMSYLISTRRSVCVEFDISKPQVTHPEWYTLSPGRHTSVSASVHLYSLAL